MLHLDSSILLAIITGIVSVIASLIVTTLRNKSELQKIRIELEQSYAKSLFDRRVKVYPIIYRLLSSYGKIIEYNRQTVENLTEFRDNFDSWDSQYSIYLTPPITKLCWRFRKYLNQLLTHFSESHLPEEEWKIFRNLLIEFEKAIRAEIGIFLSKPIGDSREMERVHKILDEKIQAMQINTQL